MKKNLEAQHKELEEKRRQFEDEKQHWEAQQRILEQQKLDSTRYSSLIMLTAQSYLLPGLQPLLCTYPPGSLGH